ncbi:NAD(P)/FAD-dependent oxidoreductase [Methylobrevis albus]|uniref:FAD-dependent oxidoreductase n=1 Tax=Methylobrevis albus TaxID=2793297 RepID=A0A931N0Z2_9HYPH|nr:FAD-dependent oxidoreductase [Methylobrevis albus]MBH0239754.1 FAD-dependent oxidoreductase [Methylobrevis albus]
MRIAVIGTGIAGNAAALGLSKHHEVVLFETRHRAGGHSATVDINYDGAMIAVDTGFIVYNELNYPLLTALFAHLGINTESSDMSFGVSIGRGRTEWSGASLAAVFAQKRNIARPRFLWMLREIVRFNRQCLADLDAGRLAGLSLGDYLAQRRFGRSFVEDYLVPMGSAIWSTPDAAMADFPAESFVRFFRNHRLVHYERPVWRTVSGGSRNYVERLLHSIDAELRLGDGVVGVRREADHVSVRTRSGLVDRFDHVVFASHTDQTLAMIENPTVDEIGLLGAIRYRPNQVYLHRDVALMPKRRAVWSSWNYLREEEGGAASVTYWMNRLQNLCPNRPLFVSLNPATPPRDDLTFGVFEYDHPQFDADALAAQAALPTIQGRNRSWFCGAWTGFGFHEDGLRSGLAVAEALGGAVPWAVPQAQVAAEAAE